ncbi:hypothetical protein ASE63_12775 [Bosea sp. Root381]|uniref:hypothetical protein n=1 Tax=Bosea sp. Root381 TaxID=1736524 RepID=UPI000701FD80|nr:hypothetical protein [Bosea sp. Root381]KRD95881.1 hypothetical protein ASE63_12775 [Bosea sp. Root381]
MLVRTFALGAGLLLAVLSTEGAVAAPAAMASGLGAESGVVPAQWRHGRHVGPRRCWWETRRVRDHRGRWVHRRVQVCRR